MYVPWPVVAVLLSLAVLLVLIVRWQWHAFAALLVVSIGLGVVTGMRPVAVVTSLERGVGDILRGVALLLGLGAILGRLLDRSGAAQIIANRLVQVLGEHRASLGVLIASYLIGIPVLFNVGFLLLIPIMYRLQQTTGRSLLYFLLPMGFSLSVAHSLVPPHPGIVATVQVFGGDDANRVMVDTILGGALLGIPMVVAGWYGPGRWWAKRQMVEPPPALVDSQPAASTGDSPETSGKPALPFSAAIAIVLLPLTLSLVGFGAGLAADSKAGSRLVSARPMLVSWFQFLGQPTIALGTTCAVGLFGFGTALGWDRKTRQKIVTDGLMDVGSMLFLFGAAGGFKQVIQDSGAGEALANLVSSWPLSPVMVAFITGTVVRAALGSATAAHVTTSAILAGVAAQLPGQATILVLAVSVGVTVITTPADSGFWMVKEYGNLSVRQVLVYYNVARIFMALVGLALLLICEHIWFG